MGYKRARISAFLVDIFFVVVLTVLIGNVSFLNPGLYTSDDAYTKYMEVYDELLTNVNTTDEVKINEINDKMKVVVKDYEKSNKFIYLYYLIFTFIYFVIFQWWNKGQTLGKKLFKLKVVDDNEENPNIFKYILRTLFNGSSLIMGVNFILLVRLIFLFIGGIGSNTFYNIYLGTQYAAYIFELVFIVVYLVNKKNKGLDDIIAGTKVISTKK